MCAERRGGGELFIVEAYCKISSRASLFNASESTIQFRVCAKSVSKHKAKHGGWKAETASGPNFQLVGSQQKKKKKEKKTSRPDSNLKKLRRPWSRNQACGI